MSLDATRWAWLQQIAGPPGVKLVLLSLADRADEYHRCYPSIARLVKDTGMHRDTVFASIERLEKAGLLTVDRRNGAGNVYTLVTIGVPYGSFLERRGIAQLDDGVSIMQNELGYYFAAIGSGL